MRVLLIKGASQYNLVGLFLDEVAAAFQRRGCEAVTVDLGGAATLDQLSREIDGDGFDLAYSMNFGEARDSAGRDVRAITGAPHVLQYIDYPLSHSARLVRTPASTALLTIDPTHVEAVRAVYGPERFKYVAFSPHGGVGAPRNVEPDADAFLAARPIPLLFPGTFYKPRPFADPGLESRLQRVVDAAVEIALAEHFLPAMDALERALDASRIVLPESKRAVFRLQAAFVHERVRAHRRFEMLKAVAKAGLPVEVYGAGYDRDLYRFKNITHRGQVALADVASLMSQARMVLSVNANFGQGSHERPLSAMLAGAAAVTDHSGFYDEHFAADEVLQLRWTSLADDLQKVAARLRDPEALYGQAKAANLRAAAEHRWDNRLEAIIAAADAVRD